MKNEKARNFSKRHSQQQHSVMIGIFVSALLVATIAMLLFANFSLFASAQGQQESLTAMIGSAATTINSGSSNNTTATNTTNANSTTSTGNQSSQAIISNIKSLLTQLISAYKIQNYTGAENIAITAYLDNFEKLEGPISTHDQQLMVQTELLLREQLRQAVQSKVPIEQVQQLVDQINTNLDKAAALLLQK